MQLLVLLFIAVLKVYCFIETPIDLISDDTMNFVQTKLSEQRREQPGIAQLIKLWCERKK